MAKNKIVPLTDRVVVSVPNKKQTLSGIIIPEGINKERPERGVVTAIGKDCKEVVVGDEVLFTKYGPETVELEGVDYFILREDQILAVVK